MPMDLVRLFDKVVRADPADQGDPGANRSMGQRRRNRIIELAAAARRETLTTVNAPREFGYLLNDIAGPMALLMDHVDGTWLSNPRVPAQR